MWASLIASAALSAPSQVEITVYNQGMGVVKESRSVNLKKGRQNVVIENVAQLIDPTSVQFRCTNNPGSVSVLEQNYQYDLISTQAILNKSVGKPIRIHRDVAGKREVIEGTLLSAPSQITPAVGGDPVAMGGGAGRVAQYGGMVVKTKDGRILLSPNGEVEVMEIPDGMISVPSLLWDLESDKDQNASMELSYITRGMTWSANYVVTLLDDDKADMKGWVTMNNSSGLSFENATLKLLAGDVNQVRNGAFGRGRVLDAPGGFMTKSRAAMTEETLFEYHLYTLNRPASVRNNENKQLSLLEADGFNYRKRIIFDPMRAYGYFQPSEGGVGVGPLSPQVRVDFVNEKANRLGMPMPQGTIRLYQRDKSGSVQLLGEDSIGHTPTGETISLVVGRSFDIRADRKRTNFEWLNNRMGTRETFEIEVRNQKKVSETVYLYERRYAEWKVTATTDPWTKEEAHLMVYKLVLKPEEKRTVRYTVESSWN